VDHLLGVDIDDEEREDGAVPECMQSTQWTSSTEAYGPSEARERHRRSEPDVVGLQKIARPDGVILQEGVPPLAARWRCWSDRSDVLPDGPLVVSTYLENETWCEDGYDDDGDGLIDGDDDECPAAAPYQPPTGGTGGAGGASPPSGGGAGEATGGVPTGTGAMSAGGQDHAGAGQAATGGISAAAGGGTGGVVVASGGSNAQTTGGASHGEPGTPRSGAGGISQGGAGGRGGAGAAPASEVGGLSHQAGGHGDEGAQGPLVEGAGGSSVMGTSGSSGRSTSGSGRAGTWSDIAGGGPATSDAAGGVSGSARGAAGTAKKGTNRHSGCSCRATAGGDHLAIAAFLSVLALGLFRRRSRKERRALTTRDLWRRSSGKVHLR